MTSEEVKKRGPGWYLLVTRPRVTIVYVKTSGEKWLVDDFGWDAESEIDRVTGEFYSIAVPSAAELERDERLAYRQSLDAAEARGDTAFIEAELAKTQLTADEIERIEKHHTPIADWPETPADLIAPKGTTTMEEPKRLTADELEFWQQALRWIRDYNHQRAAQLADEAVAERAKRAPQDDACRDVAEIRERLEESKRVADDMRSKFEAVIAEQARRINIASIEKYDLLRRLALAQDSLAEHLVQIENNGLLISALPTLRTIVAGWIRQESTGSGPFMEDLIHWAAKQPFCFSHMHASDLRAAISAIEPTFKPEAQP